MGFTYSMGAGKKKPLILSAVCFVLIAFFYFFVVGSLLHISVYTFQSRVTYSNTFDTQLTGLITDSIILLSLSLVWGFLSINNFPIKLITITFFSIFFLLLILNMTDMALAITPLTMPLLLLLIILSKLGNAKIITWDEHLYKIYISVASIIVASLGITYLFISILSGVTPFLEKYSYALYQQLLSNLTPMIMTVLAFSFPIKIILSDLFSRMRIGKYVLCIDILQEMLSRRKVATALILCVIFSIILSFIPHLQSVNPNNERLGVDSAVYAEWINRMKDEPNNLLNLAFTDISSGDRPLTLLILYVLTEASKLNAFQVAEFAPVVLAPLLVIVTFFLTRELTSNDKISIIASLLTPLSFQFLVGTYSGIYANWLALIFGYLAFVILVRYLRKPSILALVTLAVVMTGLLLLHSYTWSIIISAALIFISVLLIRHYYPRKRIFILILVLSSTVAVDVIETLLTSSVTGFGADATVGFRHGFGISQFTERIFTLADTILTYFGGAFANIPILGLIVYWLIRCNVRQMANIFVLIFLSSALVPFFLGDWVLQSRILYNIPFQIPAAMALFSLWSENHKFIFIAILLITVYLTIHYLANLGYVPPKPPYRLLAD